ncbi:hypothetical protein BJ875DRAFT_538923 [Amylocarpus encephaloides]|uniref:Uncharacterized protein n=1 Tax=Amylocarpus encephaloides TaxID=45428 RepID=A0A9P8CBL0_9HELO|nr:hypothetical protein BJ875DRAFT_538923 [Amylocarpus encephaloides]
MAICGPLHVLAYCWWPPVGFSPPSPLIARNCSTTSPKDRPNPTPAPADPLVDPQAKHTYNSEGLDRLPVSGPRALLNAGAGCHDGRRYTFMFWQTGYLNSSWGFKDAAVGGGGGDGK